MIIFIIIWTVLTTYSSLMYYKGRVHGIYPLISGISLAIFISLALYRYLESPYPKTKHVSYHRCKWDLCPYKECTHFQGVILTGDPLLLIRPEYEGSDGYYIDSLHFIYPEDDYDQLEDKSYKTAYYGR